MERYFEGKDVLNKGLVLGLATGLTYLCGTMYGLGKRNYVNATFFRFLHTWTTGELKISLGMEFERWWIV